MRKIIKTRYKDFPTLKPRIGSLVVSTFTMDEILWVDLKSNGQDGGSFDGAIPLDKKTVKQLAKLFNKLEKEFK